MKTHYLSLCISIYEYTRPKKVEAEFNDLIERKNAERKGNPFDKTRDKCRKSVI